MSDKNSNDLPNIAGAIVAFLNQHVDENKQPKLLDANSDLIESGLLDSLNIVRLIQFVESEFSCQIDDDDIEPELFASANHLANYVLSHT